MPSALATRYARALVDVVLAPDAAADPDRIIEDLREFEASLSGSRELAVVLESPAIPAARKRAVIEKLASANAYPKTVRNFLLVLVKHRRIGELKEIIGVFEHLMDERMGVLQVEVTSARALTESQEETLKAGLVRATGKKIWLKAAVDKSLIGGLTARFGSTMFDGSVRGKIDAIARRLTA